MIAADRHVSAGWNPVVAGESWSFTREHSGGTFCSVSFRRDLGSRPPFFTSAKRTAGLLLRLKRVRRVGRTRLAVHRCDVACAAADMLNPSGARRVRHCNVDTVQVRNPSPQTRPPGFTKPSCLGLVNKTMFCCGAVALALSVATGFLVNACTSPDLIESLGEKAEWSVLQSIEFQERERVLREPSVRAVGNSEVLGVPGQAGGNMATAQSSLASVLQANPRRQLQDLHESA